MSISTFNERSFPARKMKLLSSLNAMDNGADLIGFDFEDDCQTWTITEVGFYDDEPVLYYKNKTTGEEEKSSVQEVRQWYNRTNLQQATNSIRQHEKAIFSTKSLKNNPKTPNTDGAPRKHAKSAKTPDLPHTPNKSKHGDLTAQPTARRHHHTQTKTRPDLTAPRVLPQQNKECKQEKGKKTKKSFRHISATFLKLCFGRI